MGFFSSVNFDSHERLFCHHDEATGLRAMVAIHNTKRGPSLGGCRIWQYEKEEDALNDVLRLSRGMTYKSALANLNLGGGKAIIIKDHATPKTPEMMEAFGRFVETVGGRYITAEDVGSSPQDMVMVKKHTNHVVGLPEGIVDGASGDPSPWTALGVFYSIQEAVKHRFGSSDLKGMKIAVQGVGHVGYFLCQYLIEQGAKVTISDINMDHIAKVTSSMDVSVASASEIMKEEVTVFAPCALGAILNDQTIVHLKCEIIAGAANNQLAEARHGQVLKDKNILFVPDYVANAGGVINVSYEGKNYDASVVKKHVESIKETLAEIFEISDRDNVSTSLAADRLAESRFK